MKLLSQGRGDCAYLIRIVDGREIKMSYRDDDRAIKAALQIHDVVRLLLMDGRELTRADLEAIQQAAAANP